MIITDLNILEVVETAKIQGGIQTRSYLQNDNVNINFRSFNRFETQIVQPGTPTNNSAASGAKADAQNNVPFPFFAPTNSYTKADTLAVTERFGSSFSASTSVAVIG
jgi:hypothetical protein